MKILGYIVSGSKISNIEGFVEQVDDISLADSTKPILVVGWQLAKQFDGYNILNRKLGENLYWTFGRSENRSEFETDIKKFYDLIRRNVAENVPYKYINIIDFTYSNTKKLLNMVISERIKTIYINDNMLYFVFNDTVYGLSLAIMEYCGIKREKVFNVLRRHHIRLIDNKGKAIMRIGRFLGDRKYAIPYFIE